MPVFLLSLLAGHASATCQNVLAVELCAISFFLSWKTWGGGMGEGIVIASVEVGPSCVVCVVVLTGTPHA